MFTASSEPEKAGAGSNAGSSTRRSCNSSAWACADQIPSRERSQAVPVHRGLQPRPAGNKGSGEISTASSHRLCSCGIAVILQWLFHLLSTSLIVIPVNPLRDPWELLSVRAQILLFPITVCSHFLKSHSPLSTGQPRSPVGHCWGHQPPERGWQINKQVSGIVSTISYARN